MIGAALDTNVLARAALKSISISRRIVDFAEVGAFDIIMSEPILEELDDTLAKRYFRERLTAEDIVEFRIFLRRIAMIVPIPATLPRVAPHHHDDPILATVAAGNADYLVTGDRELQRLGSYAGAAIVAPEAFLTNLLADAPIP